MRPGSSTRAFQATAGIEDVVAGAPEALREELGMLRDRVEVTGRNLEPLLPYTDEELLERFMAKVYPGRAGGSERSGP